MSSSSGVSPLLLIVFTVLTGLVLVGIGALLRRYCCKSKQHYTAVNHVLDEEEMAFKKALEMQGGDIDELFNFSGDIRDELEFDDQELDQIEMIDQYREHLVAGAGEALGQAHGNGQANGGASEATAQAQAAGRGKEDGRGEGGGGVIDGDDVEAQGNGKQSYGQQGEGGGEEASAAAANGVEHG